jgi:hypothetical protein
MPNPGETAFDADEKKRQQRDMQEYLRRSTIVSQDGRELHGSARTAALAEARQEQQDQLHPQTSEARARSAQRAGELRATINAPHSARFARNELVMNIAFPPAQSGDQQAAVSPDTQPWVVRDTSAGGTNQFQILTGTILTGTGASSSLSITGLSSNTAAPSAGQYIYIDIEIASGAPSGTTTLTVGAAWTGYDETVHIDNTVPATPVQDHLYLPLYKAFVTTDTTVTGAAIGTSGVKLVRYCFANQRLILSAVSGLPCVICEDAPQALP